MEADRLAGIQAALANGTLKTTALADTCLADAAPPAILATRAGRCVFHRLDANGHACAVQTALGHDALPLACRQFPRVSLLDPRGASVVLSAYCPTAATLLDTPGPVTIVESPAAFPARGEYVGLDARQGWPPILKPGVLMDWPSWWAFETRAVDLIANQSTCVDDALGRLSSVVERVRGWTVDEGALDVRIGDAFAGAAHGRASARMSEDDARRRVQTLRSQIPVSWLVSVEPASAITEPAARELRFLACHAFANWRIHLSEDIRDWLESLRDARALLASGFGVRQADLWLRHLTPTFGTTRDRASI